MGFHIRLNFKTLALLFFVVAPSLLLAQLTTTPSANATFLVSQLIGPGVSFSNATMFTQLNAAGTFNGAASNIGLPAGVLLTSGDVANAVGPNISGSITTAHAGPGDAQLNAITTPFLTEDACILEFDMVATCDTIQISYVFGSDEYDEFVCSDFTDAFGFFISGPGITGAQNIAVIPGTATPVSINTVNIGVPGASASFPLPANCITSNSAFYTSNAAGASVEYDGFTVPLLAKSHVIPCSTYHVKLVIADAGDDSFDSGVFLEQYGIRCASQIFSVSGQANAPGATSAVEGCVDGIFTFERAGDTTVPATVSYYMGGTATAGVDYAALPGSITFPANSSTATLNLTAFADGITEGLETVFLIITDTVCNIVNRDTATLLIIDQIEADAGPDQTICLGDNIQIGGPPAAGWSYVWTPSTNLNNANIPQPVATPGSLGTHTYILQVQDTFFCQGLDTVNINVVPGPTATFTAPANICPNANGTVTYTGNAPTTATYNWNFGGGTVVSGSGAGPYTVAWPSSGPVTVSLTVADGNCVSELDSFIVNVSTMPVITLNPTNLFCNSIPEGEISSTVSNGSPAFIYAWSNGASTPNIVGLSAGTYTLTVTDAIGCTDTASATLIQPSPLTNSLSFTPILCNGGLSTISANPGGGSGAYTYLWSDGSTTQTVMVPAGQYSVTVTDLNSGAVPCQISNSIAVNEPSAIQVSLVPTNATCGLDNGEIGVIASGGTGSLNYNWSNGMTGSFINNLAPGNYTVTVEDGNGCIASASVAVAQTPAPVVTAGNDVSFCEGEGGAIITAVGSSGTPGYYYTWWCANSPCGLDSLYDNDPLANPTASQWYYVQVTDTNGCLSNVDSVFVTVLPKPLVDAGPDVILCGDSAPCQILSPTISGAPGPYTYQWLPGTGLNADDILNPCARPDTTTIYALVVTAGNGCTSDYTTTDTVSTVTVFVNPVPIADAGPDRDICLHDTTQLQGIGSGAGPAYQYQWSPTSGLSNPTIINPNSSPLITTTYTLVVWSNGCPSYGDSVVVNVHNLPTVDAGPDRDICLGAEALLDGSAGGDSTATYTFEWSPNQDVIGSNLLEDVLVSPPSTTTYYLQATSNYGCESLLDSVLVTLIPSPIADAGPDLFICGGDTATLLGSFNYTSTLPAPANEVYFSWYPANDLSDSTLIQPMAWPSQSTTYYLEVRHRECSTLDSMLLTVGPEVLSNASADTTVICNGGTVQLGSEGSIGSDYHWYPSTGLSQSDIPNPTASPTVSTTYYLVINSGVCSDTSAIEVEVLPMPDVAFFNSLTEGCAPMQVSFTQAVAGGVAYIWNFGDGSPVSNQPQPLHTFDQAGDFEVTLTAVSEGGCEATSSPASIHVGEGPTAEFSSNPNSPAQLFFPSTGVMFQDLSQGASNWTWDFGDGMISKEVNPMHSFSEPGTYFVTLTVRSEEGCTDEVVHGPFVIVPGHIMIPNVFSPNADGINDEFLVNYTGDQPFVLKIFDRWGGLMFETNQKYATWDGKTSLGQDAPEGVYYYSLRVGDRDYNGNITLVR